MLAYDFDHGSLEVRDPEMVEFLSDFYLEYRYLEGASDSCLHRRLYGLVAALIGFDDHGRPVFKGGNGPGSIAFIELLREFKLRGIETDCLLSDLLSPYKALYSAQDIEAIKSRLNPFAGRRCLFKFTKSKYVPDLLSGTVRLSLASSYNDTSLPAAISDNELEIEHQLRGLRTTDAAGNVIPVIGNRVTTSAADDYYLSCFSTTFKLQYFHLFQADCCVVITDAIEFSKRIMAKFVEELPNMSFLSSTVDYIDKYRQLKGKQPIEFRKSLDYAYESEYRFAAWSNIPNVILAPVKTVRIDVEGLTYCCIQQSR